MKKKESTFFHIFAVYEVYKRIKKCGGRGFKWHLEGLSFSILRNI
jgi:hypothetical protein